MNIKIYLVIVSFEPTGSRLSFYALISTSSKYEVDTYGLFYRYINIF